MAEKEKKTVQMNLWTFYVLAVGIVALIVALIIGGINYYKHISAIEAKLEQTDTKIDANQANVKTRMDDLKQKGEQVEETIKNKSLDSNSELVKELYGYVYDDGIINGFSCSMYREKMTSSMYSDDEKFLMAINELLTHDFLNRNITESDDMYDFYDYSENAVISKIYKMFGINYNKIYSNENINISYNEGKYRVAVFSEGDGDGEGEWSARKFLKAEIFDENTINIYDNYIFTYGYDNEQWFATSTRTIPLPRKEYIEWDNDTQDFEFTEKNKLPIYKHTFKKNTDGTYYWVSTELTNKNELKAIN